MNTTRPVVRRKNKGVGLLEVLITIVLMSIGFLAAASMQVQGLRVSQSAYYQSQAYFLANDMINRMRTNAEAVASGEYKEIITSADSINPNCANQACTPKKIAEQDVYEWGSYLHLRTDAENFVPALPSSESVQALGTVVSVDEDIWSVQLIWSEIVRGDVQSQTLSVNFAVEKSDL